MTRAALLLIFSIPLLITVESEIEFCRAAKSVEDLDLQKFAGNWYEIERLPNFIEADAKCGEIYATPESENNVLITIHIVVNEEPTIYNVTLLMKPGGMFELEIDEFDIKPNLYIIDIDYDNYFVLWLCLPDLYNLNSEFAWIFGRNKSISQETLDEIYKKSDILSEKSVYFEKVDQSCS